MNVTTSSISRADLAARAENYGRTVASDSTNPYHRTDSAENDFFVAQLDRFQGDTLDEIKSNVDATAASKGKTAKIASIAGLAMVIGGFLGSRALGPLALPVMIGGIVVANIVGGKAASEAAQASKFSEQLGDWSTAVASSQQPSQPAPAPPAPAPPAPAPAQPAPASEQKAA